LDKPRCPGQNTQYWKPEDIFEELCPFCGNGIEFWKDDPFRSCSGSQRVVKNPKFDLGCAKWCEQVDACRLKK